MREIWWSQSISYSVWAFCLPIRYVWSYSRKYEISLKRIHRDFTTNSRIKSKIYYSYTVKVHTSYHYSEDKVWKGHIDNLKSYIKYVRFTFIKKIQSRVDFRFFSAIIFHFICNFFSHCFVTTWKELLYSLLVPTEKVLRILPESRRMSEI